MKFVRIAMSAVLVLGILIASYAFYTIQVVNPRVERELIEDPDGERARRVMLLTLPSDRRIPVNYLREDERVYAAADGNWWKELVGPPVAVTLLIRGETLQGIARVVIDEPVYTKEIFERLRPNAIEGFGTLIEIVLSE
jgi:hypothetical protein